MGTWSKVHTPADSESIQVEKIGVSMESGKKALECNWSSRIKNACEQYKDDGVHAM